MLEKHQTLDEEKFRLQQEELRLNLEAEMVKTTAKERVYAAMTSSSLPEVKAFKIEDRAPGSLSTCYQPPREKVYSRQGAPPRPGRFRGFCSLQPVWFNCEDLHSHYSLLRSSHIWFSYIHTFIIVLSRVNEPIEWPRALHWYRRGQGFESSTNLIFFFRLSFRNCKSCVFNFDDLHAYNSSLRSSHIWFWYIHNFRIKFVYRLNNTRLAFQTSKTTTYRPLTPEIESISKYQLLFHWTDFEKYMIFYTLLKQVK